VVLVLAAAGAGGIQFMSLSKTELELGGLKLYLISNVILGFLLRKDNETLPLITICFIVSILCFCIALYLIGRIKEQSFYSVLSECKGMLRGVFIPVLVILNHVFLEDEYSLWITSLVTHIIVIQLLQFILKKEDEDPDQDKAIKSDDKGEGDQKGDKKAQSPLDQFSIVLKLFRLIPIPLMVHVFGNTLLFAFALIPNFGKMHALCIGWKGVKLDPLVDISTTTDPALFKFFAGAGMVITVFYICFAYLVGKSFYFVHEQEFFWLFAKFLILYQVSHYFLFILVFLSNGYSGVPTGFELNFEHIRVYSLQ
jgi:hypothetical protein